MPKSDSLETVEVENEVSEKPPQTFSPVRKIVIKQNTYEGISKQKHSFESNTTNVATPSIYKKKTYEDTRKLNPFFDN